MAHEDAKVARFAKRLEAGWHHPVVLIQRPGNLPLKPIDGHTRMVAYQKLGRPVRAWIGVVKTVHGPWDGFHDKQISTSSLWAQTIELAEHVRTAAGAAWYDEPIGSLIVKHTHAELLSLRSKEQALHDRNHPHVKKIRAAVVASRKAGHHTVGEQTKDTPSNVNVGMMVVDSSGRDHEVKRVSGDRVYFKDGGSAHISTVRTKGTLTPSDETTKQLLSEQVKRAEAKAKAAQEAADKAANRGGTTHLNPQNFGQKPSSIAGESIDKPKFRGITVDSSDANVQTQMYHPGDTVKAKHQIAAQLEHQRNFVPDIVSNTHVKIATPTFKHAKQPKPGAFVAGTSAPGDDIILHPKLYRLKGKGSEENSNFHVPTDSKYGRLESSLAHEVGHGVHRRLPQGGRDPKLWEPLVKAMNMHGVEPPKLLQTDHAELMAEWRREYGGKGLASIDDMIARTTPKDIAKSDALLNRKVLDDWVQENAATIKHAVSEYGAQSANELLAELWTEYSLNVNARPAAKVYGQYVAKNLQDTDQML